MDQSREPVRLSRPAEKRWRISVAAILAICIGALVLVAVGGVLALAVGANYRNTFDLLGARATLLIEAMEDSLRGHMGQPETAVDGIAALYAQGAFEIDDLGAMNSVLSGALASTPGANAMLIYTLDGTYRGAARANDDPSRTVMVPRTPTTEPDVLAAVQARNAIAGRVWGPFVTVGGGVFANVSVPLVRLGVKHGLVVAPVELATLSKITRDLSARYQTHAFMLYDGDRVLADEALAARDPAGARAATLPLLSGFDNLVLAHFAQRQQIDFGMTTARGVEIASITLDESDDDPEVLPRDRTFIAMTKTLTGYSPKPWTIGAYYSGGQVGDEIRRVALSAMFGIAGLVVAVGAAVLLGRLLARPVRAIADKAQRVASFELDGMTPLGRSRVRELDEQAVAFNAMLTGLRAFSTYIPRSLVAKLVRSGESGVVHSRQAIVTVMFTDIAGFTTLSEDMEAAEAADLLNHHFAVLCDAIDAEGGTVDKFLGDGMMAFFGAPDRVKGHAAATVRAAAAIRDALHADNQAAAQAGRPQLRLRIGIHTGPVIVGNIGAADRVNYTIVGDTVNISQRLQEIGKLVAPDAEVSIMVSGETAARLDERVELTSAGQHRLRGRGESTEVFLVGRVSLRQQGQVARPGAA